MRWPLEDFVISQGYSEGHPAVDLAAPLGTTIVAPEGGVVVAINNDPKAYFGGLYIRIKADSGYSYYLGHNSKNIVSLSQRVAEGQKIGEVGQTGFAIPAQGISAPTGPHVHFQMWNGVGKTVDARNIIKEGEEEVPKVLNTNQARMDYLLFGIEVAGNSPALMNAVGADELEFIKGMGPQVQNNLRAKDAIIADLQKQLQEAGNTLYEPVTVYRKVK